MQFVNKLELCGIVGSSKVSVNGDTQFVRFTVVTNHAYKSSDGIPVIESTWLSCVHYSPKKPDCLPALGKGTPVHLTGRLCARRVCNSDGVEFTCYEVLADQLEMLDDDEPLEYANHA